MKEEKWYNFILMSKNKNKTSKKKEKELRGRRGRDNENNLLIHEILKQIKI